MSSQKGNASRQRPQKYQNKVAFKNTLHDTSHRTKSINNTQVANVCVHCKHVIEWKIKYKKYKPLTQLKTCVKCSQKSVRYAYHVMCSNCAKSEKLCAKCGKTDTDIVTGSTADNVELTGDMQILLKTLSERKRRTFMRFFIKKSTPDCEHDCNKESLQDLLMNKLKELAMENEDDINDEDFNVSE